MCGRRTNSDEHVRLELGDLLRALADEVVHVVVRDAEVLGLLRRRGHRFCTRRHGQRNGKGRRG